MGSGFRPQNCIWHGGGFADDRSNAMLALSRRRVRERENGVLLRHGADAKSGFSNRRFPCLKSASNTSACNASSIAPKLHTARSVRSHAAENKNATMQRVLTASFPPLSAPHPTFGFDVVCFLLSLKNSLHVLFVQLDESLSLFTPSSCIPHFFGLLKPPFKNIFVEWK